MKSKSTSVLIILFVIIIMASGCSNKGESKEVLKPEPSESAQSQQQKETQKSENIQRENDNDTLSARAKQEGVSVEEMEQMVDELAKLTAEKYGSTLEEYKKEIEHEGKTLFQEFAQAADMLGITFKAYLDYERASVDKMTDEQKDVIAGMSEAVDLAEEELQKKSDNDQNDARDLRVVNLEKDALIEAFSLGVYKVTQDYEDEYSIVYAYVSNATLEELAKQTESVVKDTATYNKMGSIALKGFVYQGTINETIVFIELDQTQGGMATVSVYLDLTTKK